MGNKVLIYDSGQMYEIDSDLIYVPPFQSNRSFQHLLKKEEHIKKDENKWVNEVSSQG